FSVYRVGIEVPALGIDQGADFGDGDFKYRVRRPSANAPEAVYTIKEGLFLQAGRFIRPSKVLSAKVGDIVEGPFYPDFRGPNPDIEFYRTDAAGNFIDTLPASFTVSNGFIYRIRLRRDFVGRRFVAVLGNADADAYEGYSLKHLDGFST